MPIIILRKAISKWESDSGYPETEKLLVISKTLNISIDYLLNDVTVMKEKEKTEENTKTCIYIKKATDFVNSIDDDIKFLKS